MVAPLFFAHANGFPSQCYHTFFAAIPQSIKVHYLEKIGHHPDYPVTDNWPYLVREYLDTLSQHFGAQPVIGVGHSLGGILTFYAALLRPQAFHGIILLDPPLCNSLRGRLFYWLKCWGKTHWVTPGRDRVRERRNYWKTRSDAMNYFQQHALFQSFPAAVLLDFVEYGLQNMDSGYRLAFDPQVEAEIFKTLPHGVARDLPKLTVPGYFLYGKQGSVVSGWDRWHLHHRAHLQLKAVSGTHLFPLEYPVETANVVDRCITAMIGDIHGKNLVEALSGRRQ